MLSACERIRGDMNNREDKRDRVARLALAVLVAALTIMLLALGAFEPLENRFIEVRSELLGRAPTGQVAIVEIDAKSLAEIRTWPWPRHYHAQVLDRLHASKAAMVAFDVDFSSASDPASDAAFARALNRDG